MKPMIQRQERLTVEDVKTAQRTMRNLLSRLVKKPWLSIYEREVFPDLLADAILSSGKTYPRPMFTLSGIRRVCMGYDVHNFGLRMNYWYPDKDGFIVLTDRGVKFKIDMRKVWAFFLECFERCVQPALDEALHSSREIEKKSISSGTTFRVNE